MAAANAFTWASLLPEVKDSMLSYGIDPAPAIDMIVASSILILVAYFGGRKYRRTDMVPPSRTLSLGSFLEYGIGILYSSMRGFTGEHTKKFCPVIGTLFLFILFNNLLGSIPGFNPPTDKFSITVSLGVFVFVLYQTLGFSMHGVKYIKHFCGPVWWLAWLIFPIELISHFVRPFSLALRLFGNMTGDHKVVAVFFGFFPLLLPLPFIGLGVFVSLIQAFVFTLLSLVYISGALEEEH